VPSFGVHADIHPGAWRGLWGEKNQLGAAMAKGALACLCAAAAVPERRRLWLGGVIVSVALVILSTSATALLALLVVLSGAAIILCLQRGGVVAVLSMFATVVGAVALFGVILLEPATVLAALGKDPTLTGRTDIWASLLRQVEERPWLGYGYAAFWVDEMGPAWYVRRDIQWDSPTAHNGWLDVLVQLGWTGLALFVAHFALTTAAAGRFVLRGGVGMWGRAVDGAVRAVQPLGEHHPAAEQSELGRLRRHGAPSCWSVCARRRR
jgi:O-antigen ligase